MTSKNYFHICEGKSVQKGNMAETVAKVQLQPAFLDRKGEYFDLFCAEIIVFDTYF